MATTVPVVFADDFADDQLLLLEIPNDNIEKLLLNSAVSESLCFKASQEKEEVVFCSPSQTYSVRKVETSNTVLLSQKTTASSEADVPEKKRSKLADGDNSQSNSAKSTLKLSTTSSATFHYEVKSNRRACNNCQLL